MGYSKLSISINFIAHHVNDTYEFRYNPPRQDGFRGRISGSFEQVLIEAVTGLPKNAPENIEIRLTGSFTTTQFEQLKEILDLYAAAKNVRAYYKPSFPLAILSNKRDIYIVVNS